MCDDQGFIHKNNLSHVVYSQRLSGGVVENSLCIPNNNIRVSSRSLSALGIIYHVVWELHTVRLLDIPSQVANQNALCASVCLFWSNLNYNHDLLTFSGRFTITTYIESREESRSCINPDINILNTRIRNSLSKDQFEMISPTDYKWDASITIQWNIRTIFSGCN